MSKFLKITFILQAVLAILVGLPLLIAPGRFLGIFGWPPADPPLLERLLGAALLGMAWTSIWAFLNGKREQALPLIQMQAIFSGLGAIGILRHLVAAYYFPSMVWIVFGGLVVFTAAWVWHLFRK